MGSPQGRAPQINPIGVYEKALPAWPLEKRIAEAAALGFDTFEISVDETDARLARLEWGEAECRTIRDAAGQGGIAIYSICFSGHRRFPFGSANAATEARARDMMEKALVLCQRLGVRVLQMAGYDVFYEPSTPETQNRFTQNMAWATRLAEAAGVMLAVETVEKHITSVDKALELARQMDSPWFTLYPDTANLYMQKLDPVAQVALAGRQMTALHLRDGPDDTYLPFGAGDIDFDALFAQLAAMEFRGPLVVELWNEDNPDDKETLAQALGFIREKMTANPQK